MKKIKRWMQGMLFAGVFLGGQWLSFLTWSPLQVSNGVEQASIHTRAKDLTLTKVLPSGKAEIIFGEFPVDDITMTVKKGEIINLNQNTRNYDTGILKILSVSNSAIRVQEKQVVHHHLFFSLIVIHVFSEVFGVFIWLEILLKWILVMKEEKKKEKEKKENPYDLKDEFLKLWIKIKPLPENKIKKQVIEQLLLLSQQKEEMGSTVYEKIKNEVENTHRLFERKIDAIQQEENQKEYMKFQEHVQAITQSYE